MAVREEIVKDLKGDPTKILPEDVARSEAEKIKCGEPCKCAPELGEVCPRCDGVGTAVMRGTYVGDTEGQHGVCVDCGGTGWKAGKAWLKKMDAERFELSTRSSELRRLQCAIDSERAAFAADKKMAERAMEMLKGLDAREKALGDGADDLHEEQEKHRQRVLAHEQDVTRDSATSVGEQANLDAAKLELEEMRESIRKPLKKLVREVAEMREEIRAGK